jgi:hypothetical protein
MEVMLYQPDEGPGGVMEALEVQAKVRYDARQKCFVADYAREDLMYQSEAEALRSKRSAQPGGTDNSGAAPLRV